MTNELDRIEILKGMRDMAEMTHAYYAELVDKGFTKKEALTLTEAWVKGTVTAIREP
jgi:hypothetical protein